MDPATIESVSEIAENLSLIGLCVVIIWVLGKQYLILMNKKDKIEQDRKQAELANLDTLKDVASAIERNTTELHEIRAAIKEESFEIKKKIDSREPQ